MQNPPCKSFFRSPYCKRKDFKSLANVITVIDGRTWEYTRKARAGMRPMNKRSWNKC